MVFTFSHTTMHNLSNLPGWSCTVEHKLCSHPEGHGVTDPADIKDLQTIKHIFPWHSCLFSWTTPHQYLRANLLFIDAISVTLNKLSSTCSILTENPSFHCWFIIKDISYSRQMSSIPYQCVLLLKSSIQSSFIPLLSP